MLFFFAGSKIDFTLKFPLTGCSSIHRIGPIGLFHRVQREILCQRGWFNICVGFKNACIIWNLQLCFRSFECLTTLDKPKNKINRSRLQSSLVAFQIFFPICSPCKTRKHLAGIICLCRTQCWMGSGPSQSAFDKEQVSSVCDRIVSGTLKKMRLHLFRLCRSWPIYKSVKGYVMGAKSVRVRQMLKN